MKKIMLICAPVSSRSGYGEHSRDLTLSFLEHDKYDIKIIDVPWGNCPRNSLNEDNENHRKILNCILPTPEMDRQPDIYVDIRIPQEFETYGKYNIGITAGVETDAVSSKWLEGCNKMDLIIVPSEHSKEGFVKSVYDKVQNLPDGKQQKIGELKLEKPIEVLFEGANEDIYKPIDNSSLKYVDDIKEDFCFLFVGQWCQGGFGEDRKDIGKLIKIFYESFANKKNQPALILKTNGATYSVLDKEECLDKIRQVKTMFPSDWKLPNIYLLHGSFSDEEMNCLYNHSKIKSMISLTHGEGFGRPLLESTMVGLPVIAPNWSGHKDFLSETDSILIGGNIEKVPKSVVWKDIIVDTSKWFYCDENQVYKAFNFAFENEDEITKRGENLMDINRKKFTLKKMTEKLGKIMESHTQDLPQEVGIKLPTLKKPSDSSNSSQIKLPKLRKSEEVSV
jgi:glycosyltransferase involved in cell wall biosynthesis